MKYLIRLGKLENSLTVQWLRSHTSTAWFWVQSLLTELRPPKLTMQPKKEKTLVNLISQFKWEKVMKHSLDLKSPSQLSIPLPKLRFLRDVHLILFIRLWCWEVLGQEEKEMTEDEMAGWHHRLNRRWVWVNSRSWWWTRRPGMMRFMWSQRVRHDWATELNWLLFFKNVFILTKK